MYACVLGCSYADVIDACGFWCSYIGCVYEYMDSCCLSMVVGCQLVLGEKCSIALSIPVCAFDTCHCHC